jgi:hypothetical protein
VQGQVRAAAGQVRHRLPVTFVLDCVQDGERAGHLIAESGVVQAHPGQP